MKRQKILFWIYLFSDLINIYSILVATWLFMQGQLVYFIIFILLFVIIQLLFLIKSLAGDNNEFLLWVLELFSLGFIYFFQTDLDLGVNDKFDVYKQYTVLVHLIVQFIFFFCTGQLSNSSIESYVNIASVSNFIILTLFYATLSSKILIGDNCKFTLKQIIQVMKHTIFIISYFITLCSMTFYQDIISLNLIFYQLLLPFIDEIILFITRNNKMYEISSFYNIQKYLIFSIFGIKFSIDDDHFENRFILIIEYFNQLVRVVLLLVYGIKSIPEIIKCQDDIYCKIQFTVTILTFIMSLLYFLCFFKNSLNFFIKYKSIKIKQLKDLEKVTQKLNKKQRYLKQITICFIDQNKYKDNRLKQLIPQQQNQIILDFFQAISFQIKFNTKMIILQFFFKTHNIQILTDVEHFDLKNLKKQLDGEVNKFIAYIDGIILVRIQNGFIENEFTKYLLENRNRIDKQKIMRIIADRFQITAYYKLIANYIQFKPHETLFDLYDQ